MRKKNAGALFMDFHVSPEDRVGATPRKGTRSQRTAPTKKLARGARVEPGFDDSAIYVEDERPTRNTRGKAPRGKARKTRGRRERKPVTLLGVIGKRVAADAALAALVDGTRTVYDLVGVPGLTDAIRPWAGTGRGVHVAASPR